MQEIPNGKSKLINGKLTDYFHCSKAFDSKFNLSYRIVFELENIQYNVFLDRLSFLNNLEKVTVSKWDGNEKLEKNKLKNIFSTTDLKEFENKLNEILT